MSEIHYIPTTAVMRLFPAGGPTQRYLNEPMYDLGFAQLIGRRYFTTEIQINQFASGLGRCNLTSGNCS